jgi:hypothetical protein
MPKASHGRAAGLRGPISRWASSKVAKLLGGPHERAQ